MRENIKRDCSRVSTILLINFLIMSAILSYTSGWIQITGYVFEVVLVYFAICRRGEIENSKLVTYKFDTNLIFIIIAFIMIAAVFSVLSVQYEKVLNYYGYTAGYTDFHKFQIADIVIYGIVVPVAEEMVYRLFILTSQEVISPSIHSMTALMRATELTVLAWASEQAVRG